MFVSVRGLIDIMQSKIDQLSTDSAAFKSHIEECARLRMLEAELAKVRHEENRATAHEISRRVWWLIAGAFTTSLFTLGVLIAIVMHLLKFSA
jgi:hypothetical protein